MSRGPKSKCWDFTLNNPTALLPLGKLPDSVVYLQYQEEEGEKGTRHYQGMICFKTPQYSSAFKKLPGELTKASRRPARSVEALKRYTSKSETRINGPWEHGTFPGGQGKRSDLASFVTAVKDSEQRLSTRSIIEKFPTVLARYPKFVGTVLNEYETDRFWEMEVVILIGPTGCGKTRYAYDNYGEDLYSLPAAKGSGTYWDGYQGQETVLVDEMYGNRFAWSFLLRLCDRYPFVVPVHGTAGLKFTSRRIIFTSNAHPRDWYTNPAIATQWDEKNPLKRRVTEFIDMTPESDGEEHDQFHKDMVAHYLKHYSN